jgi:hypothetical protein
LNPAGHLLATGCWLLLLPPPLLPPLLDNE